MVLLDVLKDVKIETDMILQEYVKHMDARFDRMIDLISKAEGKTEVIKYLRTVLSEADEQEFDGSSTEKNGMMYFSKQNIIIYSVTGSLLIMVCWTLSLVILYCFVRQQRTVRFVPRHVRFSNDTKTETAPKKPMRKNRSIWYEWSDVGEETLV
jgi:hypothetical protein